MGPSSSWPCRRTTSEIVRAGCSVAAVGATSLRCSALRPGIGRRPRYGVRNWSTGAAVWDSVLPERLIDVERDNSVVQEPNLRRNHDSASCFNRHIQTLNIPTPPASTISTPTNDLPRQPEAAPGGTQALNLAAARAFAFVASSSRFLGGAFVSSEWMKRLETAAISSTAARNAASFAFDGLLKPLIFLTN